MASWALSWPTVLQLYECFYMHHTGGTDPLLVPQHAAHLPPHITQPLTTATVRTAATPLPSLTVRYEDLHTAQQQQPRTVPTEQQQVVGEEGTGAQEGGPTEGLAEKREKEGEGLEKEEEGAQPGSREEGERLLRASNLLDAVHGKLARFAPSVAGIEREVVGVSESVAHGRCVGMCDACTCMMMHSETHPLT